MIYYPTNIFPQNTTVDGSVNNNFSIVFNGDKLAMYQVKIDDNDTGANVYTGELESAQAYNGDIVEIAIPASTMTNGTNYVWNLKLFQPTASIFIASGFVCADAPIGATTLKLRSHPTAESGMYIKIGSELKEMLTYRDTYPIGTGTITEVTSPTIFKIATGLTMPGGNTQAILTINDEDRDILVYDPTTGQVEISSAYSFPLSLVTTYEVKDPSFGVATFTDALEEAIPNMTPYTIYSNFIETPRAYFQARSTPQINIAPFYTVSDLVNVVGSRIVTFVGSYTQAEGVEIKYHRYNIYSGTKVVFTTGAIYTSNLTYTYDGFRNGHTYGIELVCETQDGVMVSTGIIYFNVVYVAPEGLDTSVTPTASYSADKHAVHISYAAAVPPQMTNVIGFEIYRVETGTVEPDPIQHKVAQVGANVFDVYDYLVQNGKSYEWIVIPMTTDKYCVALTSDEIMMHWNDMSITVLESSGKDYIAQQTWNLTLNVTPDSVKQNINKTIVTGYGKYPKTVVGEHNYLTGAATALLGKIDDAGHYSESMDTVEKWREFVAKGQDCLLKDAKGNTCIVQLHDFGESNYAPRSKELPTQVSFAYTEIRSTENIAIYSLT